MWNNGVNDEHTDTDFRPKLSAILLLLRLCLESDSFVSMPWTNLDLTTHTHTAQHSVTSMPQICHLIFDSRVPVCAIWKPQIGMLSVCGQCK